MEGTAQPSYTVHRQTQQTEINIKIMETPKEEKNLEAAKTEVAGKEEPPRDDEGLLLKYDVIVCGTGLVQAIVASALVRAGKSVLHCDGAEVYGELDAVWNLEAMGGAKAEESASSSSNNDHDSDHDNGRLPLSSKGGTSSLIWHAETKNTSFGIEVGTAVETPYGKGTVRQLSNASVAVSLDGWTLADGKSPVAYFGHENSTGTETTIIDEEYLAKTHNIRSSRSLHAQRILEREQRYLALDATPSFILAAGRAVQGMLSSNVADYLEFKSIDGLYWLEKTTNNNNNDNNSLSRVPCNKSDVFGTKLLKPMDKRRLMKFLQLSMDYATQMSVAEQELVSSSKNNNNDDETAVAETEVQSLNERHLNQGRSLARPQNKAVATGDLNVLQECMRDGMTFDTFLEKHHKLSPKLRALVRYALALETDESSASLSQGMSSLRHHLQALGRFGTTAFLVPMYGSGELSQAFCRSAAVFGATYLLRRAPIGIEPPKQQPTNTEAVKKEGEQENKSSLGVWITGDPSDEYMGPPSSRKEKLIHCEEVVVSMDALPQNAAGAAGAAGAGTGGRILRRISILNGKLIKNDDATKPTEQRHVIFIPPQAIGNSHVIHCVTMDDSIQVAPAGCTLLHMTTTISDNLENPTELLDKAFDMVVKAKQTQEPVDEIYSTTFSHKLCSSASHATPAAAAANLPDGVHLCSHTGQVLTADVAFEQAQKIFSTICPGKEFLGLSDELDAKIKERAAERGYEDDERLMLESALGMIGAAAEQTNNNDDDGDSKATDENKAAATEETEATPELAQEEVVPETPAENQQA